MDKGKLGVGAGKRRRSRNPVELECIFLPSQDWCLGCMHRMTKMGRGQQ